MQETRTPLNAYTPESEAEKEACLESFMRYCEELKTDGFLDWVDPSSGVLMRGDNSNYVYPEGLSMEALGFPSVMVRGCRVFSHPDLGEKFYPATVFSDFKLA